MTTMHLSFYRLALLYATVVHVLFPTRNCVAKAVRTHQVTLSAFPSTSAPEKPSARAKLSIPTAAHTPRPNGESVACASDRISLARRSVPAVLVVPHTAANGTGFIGAQEAGGQGDAEEWRPIQIRAFTRDLNDPQRFCTAAGDRRVSFLGDDVVCDASSVLTLRKKRFLLERALPLGIKMHSDRLAVRPVDANVALPELESICAAFSVPPEHFVSNPAVADMYVYVGAMQDASGALAWATTCAVLNDGRPFAGVTNISPWHLKETEEVVRTVTHELGHILGFMSNYFRNVDALKKVTTRGGMDRYIVDTEHTRRVTSEHFNCMNVYGIELENVGGDGTAGSHIDRRFVADDLMTQRSIGGRYTVFSLASFESLGFYRVNYSCAEPSLWGLHSGCGFFHNECFVNGTTEYPDVFCSRVPVQGDESCTHDRLGIGYCNLFEYTQDIPERYRYFDNPRLGGEILADYCPSVGLSENRSCEHGNSEEMHGSFIGKGSRCVRGSDLRYKEGAVTAACVEMDCADRILRVRVLGGEWQECPEGKSVQPKTNGGLWSGSIICPRHADVCARTECGAFVLEPLTPQENDMEPVSAEIEETHPDVPNESSAGAVEGAESEKPEEVVHDDVIPEDAVSEKSAEDSGTTESTWAPCLRHLHSAVPVLFIVFVVYL
ncbi:hypothetical protein, conserved in T. vivax [Trypanosoma vivax Y486]|uniref:Leishmanolysin-like peptidase n=1 Tax=Trypanosoma vivax (strain Y486) TaxID=1055687 RepID=F9WRJ0_TRYVY|nr:hypothetical protein, conserved in T. vivax [Trypanosoma vivax Y486]|eukprot:CCD20174.1 hypothetical protein, conserved in T. vivax [Trypanosoma vivax Y486]